MREKTLKLHQLDQISTEQFAIVAWVGSNDVLMLDGPDIIEMFIDEGGKGSKLSDAVNWYLKDLSGNSFEAFGVVGG